MSQLRSRQRWSGDRGKRDFSARQYIDLVESALTREGARWGGAGGMAPCKVKTCWTI